MLMIVVALFAFCWLPLQTYNLLAEIYPQINMWVVRTENDVIIIDFCTRTAISFRWAALSGRSARRSRKHHWQLAPHLIIVPSIYGTHSGCSRAHPVYTDLWSSGLVLEQNRIIVVWPQIAAWISLPPKSSCSSYSTHSKHTMCRHFIDINIVHKAQITKTITNKNYNVTN